MVSTLVIGVGLMLAAPGGDRTPSPADLASYQAAKATAGRNPEAHVRLALWCEAHGLPAERLRHLALAVLTDPQNTTARGLLGLVEYAGKWARPDEVDTRVKNDADMSAKLAEYNKRRERMPATADGNWRLAVWCQEAGLEPEARAHFTTVTRLDPNRAAAWKRLGFKKQGRRWVTPEQLAAEKAEAESQRKADLHWKPTLEKWRSMLGRDSQRAQAEAELARVTDPRAVPSIGRAFAASTSPANQRRAVQMLGQIDAPNASRALALMAIYASSTEVRRAATETLMRRDRREFVDLLIAALRDPIKYEVKPVGGPGSPGALFVEGKEVNVQRRYSPPPAFPNGLPTNGTLVYDANGLPVLTGFAGFSETWLGPDELRNALGATAMNSASVSKQLGQTFGPLGSRVAADLVQRQQNSVQSFGLNANGASTLFDREVDYQIPVGQMILEARKTAFMAQQQLQADVARIKSYNSAASAHNGRILSVLRECSGQELGEDQAAWVRWWTDEQGYAPPRAKPPAPVVVQDVALAYNPPPIAPTIVGGRVALIPHHACFGAGTPVRTLTGLRPIEAIEVGDRVLTQDGTSGSLSYQPVLAVFHNRPNETLRIRFAGEEIVATGIHRFWKAGRGWVMARDLKAGDRLRVLGGTASVESVETNTVQPVFNLQVAQGQSYFVGASGSLVHDNSLVEPVSKPFDAAPSEGPDPLTEQLISRNP